MTLAQMQARFFELKGKLAVGQITEQDFKHELEKLRFQDPHGRWWMIGAQSGRWYYYDGARWLLGDPPDPGAPGLDPGAPIPGIPAPTPRSTYTAPQPYTYSDSAANDSQTISVPYTYASPGAPPPAAQPARPAQAAGGTYVAPSARPIEARPQPPSAQPNGQTAQTGNTQAVSGPPGAATARPSLGATLHQELGKVRMPHVDMPHVQMPHIQRPNLHAPNIHVPPQLVPHAPAQIRKYQPPFILLGAILIGLALVAVLWLAVDNFVPGKPISAVIARAMGQAPTRPTVVRATPVIQGGQNVDALLSVGDELSDRSQFEPAIAQYQAAAKYAPNEANVYTHWARALSLTGRIAEAIATAQKATRLDPSSSRAFAELTRAMAWAGQTTPAINAGEKAISLDKENATAHAFLAEAYLRAGRTDDAQASVDTALELDDTNPETHRAAGWVAILSKRNDDGVGEWNRTIELAPDIFLYHYEQGLVYADHLNDPGAAIPAFQKAIELYPPYIPSYIALGRAYMATNQPGPAILQFQKALTLDPNSGEAFLGLGQAFQAQQKCPQAIPYYQKALELNQGLAAASQGLEDCGALAKGSTQPQAEATGVIIAPIATAIPKGTVAPVTGGGGGGLPRPTPAAGAASGGSSEGGRIYFPVYDGQYRIYSANPDGSDRRVVTELASSPAVNMDGSRMLFYSWQSDQRGVHRIGTDGGDDTHISLRAEDTLPSWSPDGSRYVYSTRAGLGGDITKRAYTLRVASTGSKPRQDPAPIVEQAQYPTWGPTNLIVFRDCGFPTDTCGLAIVNADGSGKETLTNLNSTAPVWSPDGKRVVFMSNARNNWDLYSVSVDGGSPELLTDDVGNDGLPTFSPDGSKIAFLSNRGGGWAVYQIDPDGENEVKLFDLGGDIAGTIEGNSPAQPGQTWLEQRISWR